MLHLLIELSGEGVDNNGNNIIKKDEERAGFVKEAYEMYITGKYGAETINDILYKKGFRTKRDKKLPSSQMHRLLENPFYYGKFIWNDKIYNGNHKAILKEEVWNLAQRIRRARTLNKFYERKYKFLLAGFAYCKCGRRFTAEHHFKKSNKTYSYYHCTRGKKCSFGVNIPIKDLEAKVKQRFKEVQFTKEFYDKLLKRLKEYCDSHINKIEDEIKRLERMKIEVSKKRDKTEELVISGTLSNEVYKRRAGKYENEINNYDNEIGKLRRQKTIQVSNFAEIAEFSKDVYQTYQKGSFELKRMYLGFFWDKFIVSGKRIIKAEPTLLFKALQALQKPPKEEDSVNKIQRGGNHPIGKLISSKIFNYEFINLPVKGQSQNDIITILSDREYMANVRDNVLAINNCKK